MNRPVFVRLLLHKTFIASESDQLVRRQTLYSATESCDVAVAWIHYQVNVVRHNDVGDQLGRPIPAKSFEYLKESQTTAFLSEDLDSVIDIASDEWSEPGRFRLDHFRAMRKLLRSRIL